MARQLPTVAIFPDGARTAKMTPRLAAKLSELSGAPVTVVQSRRLWRNWARPADIVRGMVKARSLR